MPENHYEKEFDDEVYEDEYYDKHHNEEVIKSELGDYDKRGSDPRTNEESIDEKDEDEIYDKGKKVTVSFACDDCDYRWDEVIIKNTDELVEEIDDADEICPMCGSLNVTQI